MSTSVSASSVVEGPTRRDRVLRVCSEYEQRLKDLTFNCRPIIEELTRKASEHIAYAPDIVRVVAERLRAADVPSKLPTLYLIDSIVKNLGGDYLSYFSKSIQALFCHVFESCVDAETRKALYKLRTTWLPYFPAHILSAIDRHCHGIDPNWPVQQVVIVTPTPPSPTIFVNRDFLTGVGHAPGSSTIHVNAAHTRADAVECPPPRQVRSTASATAMVTTTATAVAMQPVADGLQGDSKGGRSPSPRGGEDQVRAKRLRLLAEQRQKKEQLKEELGGGGSKTAGLSVVVSAGSKHPPSHESEPNGKRACVTSLIVTDPRRQGVGQAEGEGSAALKGKLVELENVSIELLQRKTEDLQRKGLALLSSGSVTHAEYDDFRVKLKAVVDARRQRSAPLPEGRGPGDPRYPPDAPHARPVSPEPLHSSRPGHAHPFVHPSSATLPHSLHPGRGREGEGRRPPPETLHPHPLHRPPSPHGRGYHSVPPPPPRRYDRGRRRGGRRPWRGAAMGRYEPRLLPRDFPPPRVPPQTIRSEQRDNTPTSNNFSATLDRLKELGVLKEGSGDSKLDIPALLFEPQQLKERIEAVISLLHAGDACSSCGQRFTSSSSEEYSRHLDQHFRQNTMQQGDSRRAARGWFLHQEDWFSRDSSNEDTTGGGESGSVSLGAESNDAVGVADGSHTSHQSCLVLPGDSGECALCGEPLEQVWGEEEEAWHFVEAARGPNGKAYHLTCSQDAQGLKLFSPQPATPSATPTAALVATPTATPSATPTAALVATPTAALVATPTTARANLSQLIDTLFGQTTQGQKASVEPVPAEEAESPC